MNWIDVIFALFIIIVMHEAGHFIGYLIFGKFPRISFKWYGVINIGENVEKELLVWQSAIMTLMGVVTGAIPILLFANTLEMIFVYYMLCTIDIAKIYAYLQLNKWHITVGEIIGEV